MPDSLDILSEVFTTYMEPNEQGEPLVPYSMLPQILEELGLPDLEFESLNSGGVIEFEPFINTLSPLLEDQADPQEIEPQRTIFYMLSRGQPTISPETLKEAMKPLGLEVDDEDLAGMCGGGKVDKQAFSNLWQQLNVKK